MKNIGRIFKWVMWALIGISVILLVWGFAVGFESKDGAAVDTLLRWAYVMVGLAIAAVVISPGAPAMGMAEQPEQSTLRLTDTVLNLTYLTGGLAILSILFSAIWGAIRK